MEIGAKRAELRGLLDSPGANVNAKQRRLFF
jgi:hypothetical protein